MSESVTTGGTWQLRAADIPTTTESVASPTDIQIADALHSALLERSLREYAHIWQGLAMLYSSVTDD